MTGNVHRSGGTIAGGQQPWSLGILMVMPCGSSRALALLLQGNSPGPLKPLALLDSAGPLHLHGHVHGECTLAPPGGGWYTG